MNASGHATYNSRRQSRSSNKSSKSSYFCSGSSPPELHALPNTDQSGVEAIFRHFSQGMAFWECLKTCRPCLEAHSYRVLDMVENVIGFLSNNVTATAANSVGGAEKHSRSRSGISGSGIRSAPQTFVQPCVAVVIPTSPSLAAALENLPPMVLGWFALDDQQGATLIRFIYRRMLRQIASVLDEMQQMEHDQHIAWERELATYLITVLQILEGFER